MGDTEPHVAPTPRHTKFNPAQLDLSLYPPLDQQCIVLTQESDSPGTGAVRRNARHPDTLVDSLPDPDGHVKTAYELLELSIAKYGQRDYLGTRSVDAQGTPGAYTWQTYAGVGQARLEIGAGLRHLGVARGAAVGLYSANCAEWVLVDAALHAHACVGVPLYDTLGADVVAYILGHAELAAVACSAAVLPALLETLPASPTVRLVVVYAQPPGFSPPAPPPGSHARVVSLEEVRGAGRAHPRPPEPPAPADTALISYTSGTTGRPKGVVITHANMISQVAASVCAALPLLVASQAMERHVSYLPLAHIYERMTYAMCTYLGGGLGFFRGDPQTLLDDIQALRPTYFPSVPRLWNRIHAKVMAQVAASSAVKRAIFWAAYGYKRRRMAEGDMTGGRWAPFLNRLVFNKIKAVVGGEVKVMISGAAALSQDVFEFLRVVFDCVVVEGYGTTETTAAATVTTPGDPVVGHVGPPLPSCEIRLADVPELGYTSADLPDPRGEICVRGNIVFKEYYKDPETTRETIDAQGWLHTGDIGTWLPGERLKVIDRKKNIFKLSQGEYVAPEKIEGLYTHSPYVAQVFVHGDALRSRIVGVVVPDQEALLPWAESNGLEPDLGQLCKEERVKALILQSMLEEGRAAKLNGFEQVVDITLTPNPFSVEAGTMTPTFKPKRPQLRAAFSGAIADMYARAPA
ncbi:LCS3B [Auxenochlorella protothecoides x Auxenochlorella symbiontica]